MLNTILCKRTALPLGLLSLALVLPSCGSSEYKKYADNQAKQVASILRENGCMQCHSATAATPFYGNLPLIGPTVKADMREGTRYLDLTRQWQTRFRSRPGQGGRCRSLRFHASRQVFAHADALGDKPR
mgnify:CR=1 FL=1